MASFPNSDDPASYDPSMNYQAGGDEQATGAAQAGQGAPPVDRRDQREAPPPGHYPVHPSLFQPPPGYPAYGDPSRRMPGYPPDARDHMPPPGLMPMYPGYPPAMHHGWPPLDMYGRPQMPPPDYRAGDPRAAMMRMPGAAYMTGKRDGMGMPGEEGMEKEGKKPQKKTEVACDFCRSACFLPMWSSQAGVDSVIVLPQPESSSATAYTRSAVNARSGTSHATTSPGLQTVADQGRRTGWGRSGPTRPAGQGR
ncbi:hypothetical protein CALVIDRAFT_102887 [Calocera viscosa TUFC12733]|uniref:Uncharacterized protein n=1 Tax=Calocera viscosa (strain TUFC12733) TaxID=1330018 RepID=A0A167MMJ6_CALVF|nr:hypothetical protein CALVIDRAFT_102887 [Calocera viscosa TUFC12733]